MEPTSVPETIGFVALISPPLSVIRARREGRGKDVWSASLKVGGDMELSLISVDRICEMNRRVGDGRPTFFKGTECDLLIDGEGFHTELLVGKVFTVGEVLVIGYELSNLGGLKMLVLSEEGAIRLGDPVTLNMTSRRE